MKKLLENLYLASTIARKDITDALKTKSSRTNILFLFGMLFFFYWGSTIRPYDKDLQLVYIDQGSSNLVSSASLVGDTTYRFSAEVDTLEEMSVHLGSRELGVVIPADFDQQLEANAAVSLQGYIAWVHRTKAAELASKYSEDFSTLTGKNVTIEIGSANILKPGPDASNSTPVAIFIYLLVFMALSIVPYLMLEEKKSKDDGCSTGFTGQPRHTGVRQSPDRLVLPRCERGSLLCGVFSIFHQLGIGDPDRSAG